VAHMTLPRLKAREVHKSNAGVNPLFGYCRSSGLHFPAICDLIALGEAIRWYGCPVRIPIRRTMCFK
jgi:hypothetical protein